MNNSERDEMLETEMRATFQASLPARVSRASRVKLQMVIPSHWFSSAASECAGMYISGYFYGAISIAQAYVEALSSFLTEHHHLRQTKKPETRCRALRKEGFIPKESLDAALEILSQRNNFHHLNREVPRDFRQLELLAQSCINHLHTIESDVFGYSPAEQPGKIAPHKPEYWPSLGAGLTQGDIRQLW